MNNVECANLRTIRILHCFEITGRWREWIADTFENFNLHSFICCKATIVVSQQMNCVKSAEKRTNFRWYNGSIGETENKCTAGGREESTPVIPDRKKSWRWFDTIQYCCMGFVNWIEFLQIFMVLITHSNISDTIKYFLPLPFQLTV